MKIANILGSEMFVVILGVIALAVTGVYMPGKIEPAYIFAVTFVLMIFVPKIVGYATRGKDE